MKENEYFQHGLRGFFMSFVFIVLALLAVSISATYLYPNNAYCGDMVGAGFPMMFICDDWGGGSPTNSWGKIDFVDVLNGGLIPGGFLIDFVFYLLLIGFFSLLALSILRKSWNPSDLWWTIFISLGFITGLLCAFLAFIPSYLNYVRPPVFDRTTTPIFVPSPTGTLRTALPTIAPTSTQSP